MASSENKIYVTKPALPALDEYLPYLEGIWNSKWLTNNAQYHQDLENKMADYLGVKYLSLFTNGTLALVTALQALKINGEVITTPFSFVATTNALWWNNIHPVFSDIEPTYFNLDPEKIEAAITPKTTAILPVHVYGNPCNVEKIQEIADIYGLKVIYDAAHTFGNKINGQSVLNYGDLSILSFHATKPFTTMEGGAIICHDKKTKQRIDYLKNFGIANETTVVAPGINSKMNEMQAALGLLQLQKFDSYVQKRQAIASIYYKNLQQVKGIRCIKTNPNAQNHNFSYFAIFVEENEYGRTRDELFAHLKMNNIYGRRYFYPLISHFPSYRGLESAKASNLEVAEKITRQVICLPIYPELTHEQVNKITDIIVEYER